jgi:hypothetical protein
MAELVMAELVMAGRGVLLDQMRAHQFRAMTAGPDGWAGDGRASDG